MDAAHAYGEDIASFRVLHLLKALLPVAVHLFAVGLIIEASALRHIPFPYVVAEHRLAVRRAYYDAAAVGLLLGSFHEEECGSAFVHRWP